MGRSGTWSSACLTEYKTLQFLFKDNSVTGFSLSQLTADKIIYKGGYSHSLINLLKIFVIAYTAICILCESGMANSARWDWQSWHKILLAVKLVVHLLYLPVVGLAVNSLVIKEMATYSGLIDKNCADSAFNQGAQSFVDDYKSTVRNYTYLYAGLYLFTFLEFGFVVYCYKTKPLFKAVQPDSPHQSSADGHVSQAKINDVAPSARVPGQGQSRKRVVNTQVGHQAVENQAEVSGDWNV